MSTFVDRRNLPITLPLGLAVLMTLGSGCSPSSNVDAPTSEVAEPPAAVVDTAPPPPAPATESPVGSTESPVGATESPVAASAPEPGAGEIETSPEEVAAQVSTGASTIHQVVAEGVKFNPMFIYVEPGDTVQWVNMAAHNVETIDSMVPDGQERIQSELGSDVAVTFEHEGIVVYKCTPHWSTRMGGMVVVGQPADPAATIDAYLASIDTDKSALPAKGLLKKLKRDMEEKGLL